MKIEEVNSPKQIKDFLELPIRIYKGDPNWIRPLDKDIEFVFNKEKNKFWKHGEAIRWVMYDDQNRVVGRVAAFIDERTSHTYDQATGGMGFFECINDQAAANRLFDLAKNWLKARGMEAMDGPINFGERNSWWGILVEGFIQPTYQMNYNPPWYKALFENYGFRMYFQQFVYYRHLQEAVPEKHEKDYARLMAEGNYHFEYVRIPNLRKYANDFKIIYNEAWAAGHENFKEMDGEQAYSIMKKMKPILAEELAWFGYYQQKPIAFFIMVPDMNQVFKRFAGKLGLIQKLRTWWLLRRKGIDECYGILFGVVPEHQGKGVDGAIIKAASTVIHPQKHWGHMEMIWIGDFNPKMMTVAEGIGGKVTKIYWTMRFLFDPTKEYKRAPLIGGDKSGTDGAVVQD